MYNENVKNELLCDKKIEEIIVMIEIIRDTCNQFNDYNLIDKCDKILKCSLMQCKKQNVRLSFLFVVFCFDF